MRTVRSAARARNRPRASLACFLLVVFAILLALTARAGAVPRGADAGGVHSDGPVPGDIDPDGPVPDAVDPDGLSPEEREALAALLRDELGSASAAGFADAGELFDVELRHRRPSRWGRLDLAFVWRRTLDDAAAVPSRRDELWLVATWSR